jgi:hypothetical protein
MPKGNRAGGPKTPEGRLVASRNSLKTGVYSKQQFLPGERSEDFEELKSMFIDDLKPVGVVEASLVQEITALAWKKLRLERVENQYLYGVLNATPNPEEFFSAGLPRRDDIIWLLEDLSVMTEQFMKSHQQYLVWLDKAEDIELTQKDIDDLKASNRGLYEFLKQVLSGRGSNSNQVKRIVLSWKGENTKEPELSVKTVTARLEDAIKQSKSVLYLAKHMDQVEATKQLIRDRRLKNFMESAGPIRAYQDLSRAFFKALDELRKQQDWRLKSRTLET